jgi:nicotinamidase-related amidase
MRYTIFDMSYPDLAQRKAERLAELVAVDRCALLIQEMQRGVVGPGSGLPALAAAGDEIGLIDHVARVAQGARLSGVPVVHCTAESLPGGFGRNHNARLFAAALKAGMENAAGSDPVRPVQAIGPEAGDMVLPRYHGLSPLNGSALDQLLRNEGISTVIVVGVSLNIAIPNLVFDAVNHSYQVVVISDAVAGVPIEYGALVLENTLSLVASLATTEELLLAWATA